MKREAYKESVYNTFGTNCRFISIKEDVFTGLYPNKPKDGKIQQKLTLKKDVFGGYYNQPIKMK